MRVLREWLGEYWERGYEEIALSQWSITARYAPEKAENYLTALNSLLEDADPARLAAEIDAAGIDPRDWGDEDHEAWLRRVLARCAEILAEYRP